MNRAEVIPWVLRAVAGLPAGERAKTLAVFVAAAMCVGRVCPPAIA